MTDCKYMAAFNRRQINQGHFNTRKGHCLQMTTF